MCVHACNTTNVEGMEEKKCDLFRVNMSLLNPKPRRWKSTVLNYSKRWLWLSSIMPGYVQWEVWLFLFDSLVLCTATLLEACCSCFLCLLRLLSTGSFVPTMRPSLFSSVQLAFLIGRGILPSPFYTCDAAPNPVLQHGFTGSSDLMPDGAFICDGL